MDALLVGRTLEVTAVEAFLERLRDGAAAFVLEGEPGIGKTTLWREAVAQAACRSYRVLAARPAESEARLAFAALADLLADVDDAVFAGIPEPQRRALDAALLRADAGPGAHDRRAVSTAVASVLAALAEAAPVLVAVDDVQWLDRPTASALEFAARRLGPSRVGFFVSVRVARDVLDPLGLKRAFVDERLTRVQLGPLSLGALHHLVAERLGRPLPRSALVRIERVSDGNPLFTLEIARLLMRDGVPEVGAPLPVPGDVGELLARRIARLPAKTQDALLVASALSQPTTTFVGRASLARAEEAEIVRIGPDGSIVFSHPLFASAVYASASEERRRAVHDRLGRAVRDLEERARHLALAAAGPDETVASALEVAGERARRRGAPETAAEVLDQARVLTPPAAVADALRRGLRAAEHHFDAGDRERARSLLEEILAGQLPAPLRAPALRLLGQIRYYGDDLTGALEVLREALSHAGDDAALAAPTELHLAFVLTMVGDLAGAARHAHAALAHAEHGRDQALLAEALAVATIVDFLSGGTADDAKIERALRLEDPDRSVFVQLRPTLIAGLLFMWTERLERAHELLRALRARMLERGEESDLPMGTFHLAWLECWRGDYAAAETLAEEALAVSAQVGGDAATALSLIGRALPRSYRGDVAGARADAEEALAICERIGWAYAIAWSRWVLGFLALSVDDPAGAHRVLGPLVDLVEPAGIREPMSVPFLPDEIEALVALGEYERAEALTEHFHARAVERRRTWAVAAALRCQALLLAARGEAAAAEQALEQALIEHGRIEIPFERGRTLLALGRVRRRARKKRAAGEALEHAADIFDGLGAQLWTEAARAELARLGLRRRPAGELTETEERVAQLAASGLTNRGVAAALFISPKTVEANLARVYRKLGIRSRAELGSRIARADATQR